VGAIVADEDLLFVVHYHAIREFKMLRTAKLLQDVAGLIKNDDAHYLALHYDDTPLRINGDAAWMLEDVGAKFAHELTVLIVDLYLMGRRTFRDDDVAGRFYDGDPIRIKQLAVAFTALAKLKLEPAFLVKDLDAVIVRVGDNNIVLRVHRNT